jgi:hypothetical protein
LWVPSSRVKKSKKITDVSGQLIAPIFKGQEVQEEYRRFGTTYPSHRQGSRSPRRVPTFRDNVSVPSSRVKKSKKRLIDPWRWGRYVVPKRRQRITTRRCVIPQKSTDLISIAAEAWNDGKLWTWTSVFRCISTGTIIDCLFRRKGMV